MYFQTGTLSIVYLWIWEFNIY